MSWRFRFKTWPGCCFLTGCTDHFYKQMIEVGWCRRCCTEIFFLILVWQTLQCSYKQLSVFLSSRLMWDPSRVDPWTYSLFIIYAAINSSSCTSYIAMPMTQDLTSWLNLKTPISLPSFMTVEPDLLMVLLRKTVTSLTPSLATALDCPCICWYVPYVYLYFMYLCMYFYPLYEPLWNYKF